MQGIFMQMAQHPVDSDGPPPHCEDRLRIYTCPPAGAGGLEKREKKSCTLKQPTLGPKFNSPRGAAGRRREERALRKRREKRQHILQTVFPASVLRPAESRVEFALPYFVDHHPMTWPRLSREK